METDKNRDDPGSKPHVRAPRAQSKPRNLRRKMSASLTTAEEAIEEAFSLLSSTASEVWGDVPGYMKAVPVVLLVTILSLYFPVWAPLVWLKDSVGKHLHQLTPGDFVVGSLLKPLHALLSCVEIARGGETDLGECFSTSAYSFDATDLSRDLTNLTVLLGLINQMIRIGGRKGVQQYDREGSSGCETSMLIVVRYREFLAFEGIAILLDYLHPVKVILGGEPAFLAAVGLARLHFVLRIARSLQRSSNASSFHLSNVTGTGGMLVTRLLSALVTVYDRIYDIVSAKYDKQSARQKIQAGMVLWLLIVFLEYNNLEWLSNVVMQWLLNILALIIFVAVYAQCSSTAVVQRLLKEVFTIVGARVVYSLLVVPVLRSSSLPTFVNVVDHFGTYPLLTFALHRCMLISSSPGSGEDIRFFNPFYIKWLRRCRHSIELCIDHYTSIPYVWWPAGSELSSCQQL